MSAPVDKRLHADDSQIKSWPLSMRWRRRVPFSAAVRLSEQSRVSRGFHSVMSGGTWSPILSQAALR